jgi:subtilisin family serine protease
MKMTALKKCLVAWLAGNSMIAMAGLPAWQSKVSPWLLDQFKKSSLNETQQTVLIYLKDEATFAAVQQSGARAERIKAVFNALVETSEKSQASLLQWLASEKITARSYYVSNMIAAEGVTKAQLDVIAQREDVMRVVGNPEIKNVMPSTNFKSFDEPTGPGANITRFGATRVWDEFRVRGENIVIAGQDTGVRWDHKALQPHYRGWNGTTADHAYSWHDSVHKSVGGGSSCGYNVAVPCDDNDHGTHTIGTVVGDDNQGNQIGVAPGAKWVACRNMDAGMGNPEMYTECFQWFLAPWPQNGDPIKDARPEMAPHVINNSWGCPRSEGCEGGEFERILKAMRAAGIFVVVSAGNEGSSCSTIKDGPAFHSDLVLSVGAVNHRNDSIASFSSRGPSTFDNKVGPHVSAPGVDVRSAVRSGGYAEFGWSGTSMAGPHVVGLIALLWSADPSLIGKIEETEAIVKDKSEAKTSTQTCGGVPGTARPNNTFGHGIANAYEVVKARLSK